MQTRHILPLTGIRIFAAIWVVLNHFPLIGMLCPAFRLLDIFERFGAQAVPFFFLLSGFILSHNYFSNYSIAQHPRFVFLRFARLWPVHVITLLLVAPPFSWPKVRVEELLMVRSWFENKPMWNAPAWSISAEWFAYICVFPLAFLLFNRIRSVPILVGMVAFFLVAQVSPINDTLLPNLNKCSTIFFLFLTGAGLYKIRSLVKDAPAEMLVLLGIVLFLTYLFFNETLPLLVLYVSFALVIFGLSYERGLVARVLSTNLIVQGGLISYSLYMTHYLVIQSFIFYTWPYWKTWEHSTFTRYVILLGMTGLLIGVAAACYRYVELPANRKLRSLLK